VIVRILGEGQYSVPDSHRDSLNVHDGALAAAVASGSEPDFRATLDALLAEVRSVGAPLPDEELVPSDLVLPSPTATIDEVRRLSGDEGLVGG